MNRNKTQANHVAIISINLSCFELWIVNQKDGVPTDCELHSFCFTSSFFCSFFFLTKKHLFIPFWFSWKASFKNKLKWDTTQWNLRSIFRFSISIHDILCEVFLGEAIKAAIWDFPFPSKKKNNHPKIRLKTTIPSMSMANDVVQRPLLVMLMFVSQH